MAISKQKQNLADIIVRRVAEHLDEKPGDARMIALAAVRSYCYELTYRKMQGLNWSLEFWFDALGQKAEAEPEMPVRENDLETHPARAG